MDMKITRAQVRYCSICETVTEQRNAWEEEQRRLVAEGTQEEEIEFAGVQGYIIKDADEYKYSSNQICEKCMEAMIKGVGLIKTHKLTGISLDSNK